MTSNKKTTWLHWVLYGLIILATLTPFIAFQHIFMGPLFFKTIAFWGVTEIMLIVYLVLLARKEVGLPRKNWINISLGVLLLALVISTIFSVQPFVSFWGSSNRIMGLATWIHLSVFAWVVGAFLQTKEQWLPIIRTALVMSVLVALYGLGQYLNLSFLAPSQSYRVESVMGNSIFLASYLMVLTPMTTAYAYIEKHKLWKWIAIIALVLQLIVLSLLGSQGALVALALSAAITLLIISFLSYGKKILSLAGSVILLMAIIYFGTYFARDSQFVTNNPVLKPISEINLIDSSSKIRLYYWQQGLEAWQQKPLLGWGPENFNVAFNKVYKPFAEKYDLRQTWADRAHNNIIDWLVTTGIVGFLAYFIFVLSVFIFSIRTFKNATTHWQKFVGISTLAVLVAYVSFNFFAFDMITGIVFFMMMIAMISSQVGPTMVWKAQKLLWILIPVVIFAFYPFVIKNLIANKTMSNAIVKHYTGQFNGAFKTIDNALSYNTFISNRMRNQFLLMGQEVYARALQDLARQQDVIEPMLKRTIEIGKDVIITEPHTAFYYSNVLDLYSKLVAWDNTLVVDGKQAFERLNNMSPNRPNTYVLAGDMYLAVNSLDLSEELYRQALELNPEWELPYQKLALLYQQKNNQQLLAEILAQASEHGFMIAE